MYNFLVSAGAAVAVFLILKFAVDLSVWIALPVSFLLFAGIFVLISRTVMKKVNEIMEQAARDFQSQRFDKGIKELLVALKYEKWQIYVGSQVHAQVGIVQYVRRNFNDAFPHLEKGFFKNWVAMGMLAITYMKRNRRDKMVETFEKALQASPKEALLWNVYAWCVAEEGGDRDKGIEILEKGLKKLPGDERIESNLELLKDGKKMKMKNFGEMWYQFHLEKPTALQKQQAQAMGMRRKVIRK